MKALSLTRLHGFEIARQHRYCKFKALAPRADLTFFSVATAADCNGSERLIVEDMRRGNVVVARLRIAGIWRASLDVVRINSAVFYAGRGESFT
jgi:hypothetical protein